MRHRTLAAILVLTAVLTLAAGGCRTDESSAPFALPDDLLALLPPEPTVVFAVAGLDAVDAVRVELAGETGGDPLLPPDAIAKLDLRAVLDEQLPGSSDLIAPGLPLAFALIAPPPGAMAPKVTVLLPLRDPEAELPDLPAEISVPVRHGVYVALSTDPAFAPAETPPALARGLQPGLMTCAVDLAALMELYRPVVETGLSALTMAGQMDAEAEGDRMTPEEAASVAETLRSLLDAVRRLDLAVDLAAGEVRLAGFLGVTAGSVLEPAAQPDFGVALELSGFLPPDADLLEVLAMDQSRQMDLYRDLQRLNMRQYGDAVPADKQAALEDWLLAIYDLDEMFACPAAAAADFTPEGMQVLAVLRPQDPAAVTQTVAEQFAVVSQFGFGIVFAPEEAADVGGHAVRRWRIEFDAAALAELESEDPGSGDALEAAQMVMLLQDLLPRMMLAEVGPHIVFGATEDDAAFADLVARVDRGDAARPDPRAAAAARAAGPDCQEVVLGDLAPMLNWLAATMDRFGGDGGLPSFDTPLPFTTTATVADEGYGFSASTDVAAIRAAVAAMQALDED